MALGTSWVLLFGLACNVRAFQAMVDPTPGNSPAVGAPPQFPSDYTDTREEPFEVQPLGSRSGTMPAIWMTGLACVGPRW